MSAPPPTAVCPHCGRVVDLYHDDGLLLLTCHDLPDTYRVCPASATAAPGESR